MIYAAEIADALIELAKIAPDKTPNFNEEMARSWFAYFQAYPSWTGDDLAWAVEEYNKRPRERMVQPADLGELIKAMRQDRYQRADPNTRDNPYGDLGGLLSTHPLSPGRYVDPDGGYTDSNGVRRDRHGVIDKAAPEIEYDDDANTDQRLDAYWRKVREQKPEYAGLTVRPATAQARDTAMRRIGKTLGALPDDDDDDLPRINPLTVPCEFCKASHGQPCRTPGVGKMRRSPGHPSRITAAAIASGYDPDEAERVSERIHAGVLRKYRANAPSVTALKEIAERK